LALRILHILSPREEKRRKLNWKEEREVSRDQSHSGGGKRERYLLFLVQKGKEDYLKKGKKKKAEIGFNLASLREGHLYLEKGGKGRL